MKPIVLYASRTGNTKKIAQQIANTLNCKSLQITKNSLPNKDLEQYDLIFIGSGILAGNPNEDLSNFLQAQKLSKPKTYAVFITWGGAGNTDQIAFKKLKQIIETQGHTLLPDCFSCYGGWQYALLRRGHPNNEDERAACEWAKKIVSQFQDGVDL